MTRAELETTAPIKRDELLSLLDAMETSQPSPAPRRVFKHVDWDHVLAAAVSAMVTPNQVAISPVPKPPSSRSKRKPARPFSHIAALLPPCEHARVRATRPPPLHVLADRPLVEQKAARTVAEARARLDTVDDVIADRAAMLEHGSFPVLSPQVINRLSTEQLAMLPMELRPTLPDAPIAEAEPSAVPASVQLSVRIATIVGSFAAAFVVGACAVRFLF